MGIIINFKRLNLQWSSILDNQLSQPNLLSADLTIREFISRTPTRLQEHAEVSTSTKLSNTWRELLITPLLFHSEDSPEVQVDKPCARSTSITTVDGLKSL